jgi:hypothetical protein
MRLTSSRFLYVCLIGCILYGLSTAISLDFWGGAVFSAFAIHHLFVPLDGGPQPR